MKMHPTANSDESIIADRSAHVARYTDHPSQRTKDQISSSKNAQTHLSQNAAHSSTYGPSTTPSDWHIAYPERAVNNIVEDQRGGPARNPEQIEQKHKAVGTHDVDSPRRYQSKSCAKLYLWCVTLCRRKKEYSKRVLGKPTRRFLEWSKECRKPDETTITGVSTAPHRDTISRRSVPKKSKRSRKQDDTVEVTDKDVFEDAEEEKKERKRREMKEKERRKRRETRKREEKVSHFMDTHLMARDEDLVVEDHVRRKPPSITDLAKSCCYLCAQNTLAIAAATSKPEQSDKCVQVSAHKFRTETSPTLDKSCSPMLLVRTVQSSVKVRTRETSTLCPGMSAAPPRRETEPGTKKRKKFSVFPGLTRTKCPAGRHAACETDKSAVRRDDNAEKREPKNEKCCRERNA